MTRSLRLLELLQLLRTYQYPISASTLAEKLEVTTRTIYRDINTLRQQGADIVGEAGMGYILRSDNHLPPLNFTLNEVYALVLGLRWVKRHGDASLVDVSNHAYAKIRDVIPEHLQNTLIDAPLMIATHQKYTELEAQHSQTMRHAINQEYKVSLTYLDAKDKLSQRVIYPLAIGFYDDMQIYATWCELRQAFRHFRLDRIVAISIVEQTYSPSRAYLFKRWKREMNIPSQ